MRSFCLKFVYFIIFFLIHIIKIFQKRKKSIFKIYKNSQRNYKKKTKQIQRKKKGFLASVLSWVKIKMIRIIILNFKYYRLL